MDEKVPSVVEVVAKTSRSTKVLIGVAAGAIVTGVVVLAVKKRRAKAQAETEEQTEV